MRRTIVITSVTMVFCTISATSWAAPTPNDSNCAGVFASNFASGPVISGLAKMSTGVSELVRIDANCGDN